MNSVEQARAKKRAAGASVLGTASSSTSGALSGSGTFQRAKPIPSPPPVTATQPQRWPRDEAPSLSRENSSSGIGRKALPSIPQGAVHMSPKTRKVQQLVDRTGNGADERDVEAIMRRIDNDSGDGTPEDPMDGLNAEEYEAATQIFGRRITPEFLREHTGVEDLHLVTSTEILVDSRNTAAMDNIGELMPRLVELRLSHSRIPVFRDLGTKYADLQVLYLNNARMEHLRGISVCRKLKELYLAFNVLTQLSDLGALEFLEVLDVEANRVSNVGEVDTLSYISSLRSLCLEGNPVCVSTAEQWSRLDDGPARTDMTFREYVARRIPQLDFVDDVAVKATSISSRRSAASHSDPMSSDLAQELVLVQSSVRSNVNMDRGLEGAIEGQNRSLYSRQSTSCSGARRRTPASQSTPRSSAHSRRDEGRTNVNSAPTESFTSSPQKYASGGAPAAPSNAFVRNPSSSSLFDKRSSLNGGDQGAASLLTSGETISGSLAKSLRRRLPSITGVPTKAVAPISDESLAKLRQGVSEGTVPDSPRTMREHELVAHINRMKESRIAGEAQQEAAAMASVLRLLDEMGLEMDMECAMGDDEDGLEKLRKEELMRLLQAERPTFLEAYRDRIPAGGSSDDDDSSAALGNSKLTDEELIREVAKLKQRTLRDVAHGLVDDPQQFESLQMDDLGGNMDDVL